MMQLVLRAFTFEDAKPLATLANDYQVSKNLRNIFPYPYLESDAHRFLQYVDKLPPDKGVEYAITVDGVFAGAIGITFSSDIYQKNAEIGYWLGRPYWNKGIISRAIPMLVEYTFENYPIHKITAEVFATNIGSQRVLEKNGFILEGICKEHAYKEEIYHDVHLYALFKK